MVTPSCSDQQGLVMIPTIVINLDRDMDRRTTMATRLSALNVPHTFLRALDGRDLSPEELERYAPRAQRDYPIPLLPGEIACGISHLTAIAAGLRHDGDFFCVLEDDLLVEPDLAVCLDPQFLASLPAFDVLRLFTHIDRWDKPSKIVKYFNDRIVVRMLRPGWGCQGQIYSRRGAEKILKSMTNVCAPMDFALYHDCRVSGLKVLEMRPGIVARDFSKPSSIGERPPNTRTIRNETVHDRINRNSYRVRRKWMAAISFFRAWGVREFLSFFSAWR
jgi:glycosyl transferase family 25